MLRHSKTKENELFHIQGRKDYELSPLGISMAKDAAKELKKLNIKFDKYYSSPLIRAKKTLEIVKEELNDEKKYEISNGLIERDFGSVEGMTLSKETYDLIFSESATGFEKRDVIVKRVKDALFEIIKNSSENDNILISTHAHVIKSLVISIIPDFRYDERLDNLSLTCFEYSEDTLKLVFFNKKLV